MEEVFSEIQKLSIDESECSEIFLKKSKVSGYFGSVIMNSQEMESLYKKYDNDTIVSISRGVTDLLAEKSRHIGFVTYFDNTERSDLIHFRMRRSKKFNNFDLREVISMFNISNGGGHEGAIAFRIPRGEIKNVNEFTDEIITTVTGILQEL